MGVGNDISNVQGEGWCYKSCPGGGGGGECVNGIHWVAWSSSVCILKGSFHHAPVAATHLHWCIPVLCIGAQGAVSEGKNTAD